MCAALAPGATTERHMVFIEVGLILYCPLKYSKLRREAGRQGDREAGRGGDRERGNPCNSHVEACPRLTAVV